MSGPLTLRFTTQATLDIRRITRELSELQAKVASGREAKDLQGFGGASSRLLNAQSMRANADARASVINQLQARFGVQGAALGQVSEAAGLLAQSIREAIMRTFNVLRSETAYLFSHGVVTNEAYTEGHQINILMRSGELLDIAQASDLPNIKALSKIVKKNYLCWPKNVSLLNS